MGGPADARHFSGRRPGQNGLEGNGGPGNGEPDSGLPIVAGARGNEDFHH